MKKITLLLTIFCAGQLYGMESEQNGNLGAFEQLPKELRQKITKIALTSSTTVDEAIKSIQGSIMMYSGIQLNETEVIDLINRLLPNDILHAMDAVKHLQGNNVKDFTKLMTLLANKLNTSTEKIIGLFDTPISYKYKTLYKQLNAAVSLSNNQINMNQVLKPFLVKNKELIAGIDPQILFTTFNKTENNKIEVIKLLLEYGANPYGKNKSGETFIEYINRMVKDDPTNSELKTIQALLSAVAPK